MALDHALAEAVGAGESPPVLRFYGWNPAAVSLGYNQPVRERRAALERLRARGLDAVRRPTGGRAVLHAHEVTYAVVTPLGLAVAYGGVRETCARIHAAIRRGLELLGLRELTLNGAARRGAAARTKTPAAHGFPPGDLVRGVSDGPRAALTCFATPSRSEIAWRGRKLVGSAQRRLGGAVLQHGSILLSGDQAALEEIWPADPVNVEAGPQHSTLRLPPASLLAAAGRDFTFADVAEAVGQGFGRELGIAFRRQDGRRDPGLQARVGALIENRYASEDFLYRL